MLTGARTDGSDFASASDVVEFLVLAAAQSIVFSTTVVLLEVSLDPLAEFQVVLVLGLNKLRNVDVTLDSVLLESCLQYLVVVYKFVFVLGAPLYASVGERSRVEAIHDSAVDSARRALLDLRNAQLHRREVLGWTLEVCFV